MSVPTASEVTNLYLYGKKTVPNNLVDDALIRPKPLPDSTFENVNSVEYMSTGAGRFALASMSSLVEMFFLHLGDIPGVIPGNTYTKAQMASIFGLTEYGINVQQYSYDDGQGDYGERIYIWNSTAFKISDDTTFIVDVDGTRHIENFSIVPRYDIKAVRRNNQRALRRI